MSGWQDVISRAAEVVAVIFRSLGIVKTAYEENGIDFYKQMMIGERSPTLFECVLAFCFACRIPPLLQLRKLVLPGSILDTRMKFLLCADFTLGIALNWSLLSVHVSSPGWQKLVIVSSALSQT